MISCSEGRVRIKGEEATIVAEYMTLSVHFFKGVLLPKWKTKKECASKLRQMIEEVITYEYKESNKEDSHAN